MNIQEYISLLEKLLEDNHISFKKNSLMKLNYDDMRQSLITFATEKCHIPTSLILAKEVGSEDEYTIFIDSDLPTQKTEVGFYLSATRFINSANILYVVKIKIENTVIVEAKANTLNKLWDEFQALMFQLQTENQQQIENLSFTNSFLSKITYG